MDTKQFDILITQYKTARENADMWVKEKERIKQTIMDLMETAKKTEYIVEGIGTVKIIERKSVRTPKTAEDKRKFFNYLEEVYGPSLMQSMQTVNSKTLNGFYREEANKATSHMSEQEKAAYEHRLPGLEPPQSFVTLSFRKG